jgi:hypothetical protein
MKMLGRADNLNVKFALSYARSNMRAGEADLLFEGEYLDWVEGRSEGSP